MHERTKYLLSCFGVQPEELPALDAPWLDVGFPLAGGNTFCGKVGCGKTWFMVQIMGSLVESRVVASSDPDNAKMPPGFVRWVNWPSESEELKRMLSNGFNVEAGERVDELSDCSALFLDDLGQERIKSEEDWSLGAVREILDTRHRRGSRTFITTNLPPQKLAEIYGARIVSRILASWPIIQFPDKNLRNQHATR